MAWTSSESPRQSHKRFTIYFWPSSVAIEKFETPSCLS